MTRLKDILKRNPMLGIGVLGLVVRLLFLWDTHADPSFVHPVVDAKTYHDLARGFPTTGWHEGYLWQAVFYPAFLTLAYKVFGVSVLAVKILQALLGAATCALTCRLGSLVYSRNVGIGAGLILVFYGPLLFFESRLLATTWATFWAVTLALLLRQCLSRPTTSRLLAMGLVLALAIYTRPTFIPVGLAVLAFLMLRGNPPSPGLRRRAANVCVVCLGFAVIAGPASVFFRATTGHLGLVPPSGGINLFIGNNPDADTTILIRPGLAWANLVAEPQRQGFAPNPWSGDRYFRGRVLDYVRSAPGAFLAGIGEKVLALASSREIPRNLDVYLHRQWSQLLSVTTWKIGAWGFPFGLVFPFAMVGFVRAGDKQAWVLKVLLAVMAAAVVLVFVSARYRTPLLPLIVLLGANGFAITIAAWQRRQRQEILKIGGLLVGGLLLCTMPGPFVQEEVNLTAELYFGVAEDLYDQQQWSQAVAYLDHSIALDSEVHAARQIMGISLANLARYDQAIVHFEEAIRLYPGHAATETNLKQCRQDRARHHFLAGREFEASDPFRAVGEYQAAVRDLTTWYKPIARRAYVLATTKIDSVRDGKVAVLLAQSALEYRSAPDPYLQLVLAVALAETGQFEAAVTAANDALPMVSTAENSDMAAEIRAAITLFNAHQPMRR